MRRYRTSLIQGFVLGLLVVAAACEPLEPPVAPGDQANEEDPDDIDRRVVCRTADGTACDDEDRCTSGDVCQAGLCRGAPRTRESTSCDGVDDDCDGVTDEDCQFTLSGGFVDLHSGVGREADPTAPSVAPSGAALGVTGQSFNQRFVLRPRTR
jgi:hypothetical protein